VSRISRTSLGRLGRKHPPALRALTLQFAALVLNIALSVLLAATGLARLDLTGFALTQGAAAAVLTRSARLPPPLPWLFSCARAYLNKKPGRFLRSNYHKIDLADYDVVFAYLSPAAMPDLWAKAHAEKRPGSLLLSYEFPIPGVPHQFALQAPSGRGRMLFGWRM